MPPLKNEFEVERIVSDKYLVGKRFFFVKWKNFPSSENSWEPEENLVGCTRMVREYFGGKGLRNPKAHSVSSTLLRSINICKRQRPRSRKSSVASAATSTPQASTRSSSDVKPIVKHEATPSASDCSQQNVNFDVKLECKSNVIGPSSDCDTKIGRNDAFVKPSPVTADAEVKVNWTRNVALEKSMTAYSSRRTRSRSVLPSEMHSFSINLVPVDVDSVTNVSQRLNDRSEVGQRLETEMLTQPADSVATTQSESISAVHGEDVATTQSENYGGDDDDDEYVDASTDLSTSKDRRRSRPKIMVRMFDRTPRPEIVATSTPYFCVDDSDDELPSWRVNEADSDKENAAAGRRRVRRRGLKRGQKDATSAEGAAQRKIRKTGAAQRPHSVMQQAKSCEECELRKDLGELRDQNAAVLVTQNDASGVSSFVVHFPRLKSVKTVPQSLADKYYSQAVISYYRRMAGPIPATVSRRNSF